MTISRGILLRMRNVPEKKNLQRKSKHILHYITFFPKSMPFIG
jgi:hypothetical protein